MPRPDLNLLVTLSVLLSEGSVARAGRRLRLSPSAMSRALARLRDTTGDPLLVRSGRGLVPTPRALALRERVGPLVEEVEAVLRPAEKPRLERLARTFTVRTRDGFVESFGPALLARVRKEAPGVRLRFVQKTSKDSAPLRDGDVDLETGVVEETTSPELRAQALFRDRLIGVVRRTHPLCGAGGAHPRAARPKGRGDPARSGVVTAARYVSFGHIAFSGPGLETRSVDDALRALGLEREIVTTVGGFATALALARATDLIACVPERHTSNLRLGLHSFPLPVATPELTVSMLWHPRLHADPAHQWLRGLVREVCASRSRSERARAMEPGRPGGSVSR